MIALGYSLPLSRIPSLAAIALLAACTSAPVSSGPDDINDPYEGANRRVHAFNKGLDANLVRPLTSMGGGDKAEGSGAGLKDGMLVTLANFGGNLSLPGKVLNSLLQGRPGPAIKNTFRFAVNTTIGIGGLRDPASSDFGLPEIDTDFGETLYVWGVPEGAYVELPVLGPSTARDATGKVVDLFIDPLDNWLNADQARGARAVRLISKAGDRARFGDTVDSVLHDSADSYAQTRLLYLMHRRHELGQQGGLDDSHAIDPYQTGADEGAIDPYE